MKNFISQKGYQKACPIILVFALLLYVLFLYGCCCCTTPIDSAKSSPLQQKFNELADMQKNYWAWEYPDRKINFVSLFDAFSAFYVDTGIPINEKLIMMYFGKPDNIFKQDGYLTFVYRAKEYKIRFIIILKDKAVQVMRLRDSDKALLDQIFNNKKSVPVTESELNKITKPSLFRQSNSPKRAAIALENR